MTCTGRTQMLVALACRPEGLTIPQLAKAIGEATQPWQRAFKLCGTGMRLHERLGRAERTAPAKRGRAVVWQITPGRRSMAGFPGGDCDAECPERPGRKSMRP